MRRLALLSTLGLFTTLAACTEANLYHRFRPPAEPDRMTLQGRVCTEDPASARFPVKVVLVVDQAAGPLFSSFDPGSLRIQVLSAFVQSALTHPEYELAVVGYAGASRKLAPLEGNFTRNPGELLNAINQLSLPQPCIGNFQCRRYREGLRTARALIEGDMAEVTSGERILTQYVIILANAGLHQPLTMRSECCQPTDTACITGGNVQDPNCQAQLEVLDVVEMSEAVQRAGAAGLRLHVVHLAAELASSDNDTVGWGMGRMAFAGSGLYQRFASPNTFTLTGLDVLNLRTVLSAKHLLVSNANSIATADGQVVDSDADGLPDADEELEGTLPDLRDSDGDGIGDLVEILVGFDPLAINTPSACTPLENPERDLDRDGLSNCDEALIGTDPSLVDSDGDALPDRLELVSGTDYVNPDAVGDIDGDGVSNADEVAAHTDPRSSDATGHLAQGYRYQIVDEGFSSEPSASRLRYLTGVEIIGISDGTADGIGGVGTLRFFAGAAPSLTWQDPLDARPGPAVAVGNGGEVEVPSSSYAPVQGEAGRKLLIRADPAQLPPVDTQESVRVIFRERQCLSYTVRNVKLMETLPTGGEVEGGWNDLFIYFAQAPEDRTTIPGPFRIANLPVQYIPPDFRNPPDAIVTVMDEEFVRPPLGGQP
ncbi:MAG: hypothetical protein P1V51_03185 [Deltaproteobacteria bacterium]|nr:hypothetical protein [Deltaproteobacteria bacterium]